MQTVVNGSIVDNGVRMSIGNNNATYNLLKQVYLDGVDNLKYQSSPVLANIEKRKWVGGNSIKYAAQYGNGGNFGSSLQMLVDNETSGAKNLQWEMDLGQAFGYFYITKPEYELTDSTVGSYMTSIQNNMEACFDGLSKQVMATYLYGGKFGIIDTVKTAPSSIAATGNKMTIHTSGALKMDVGSRFQICSGAIPSISNVQSPVYTVSKIENDEITFSANATTGTIAEGDLVILYTAVYKNAAHGFDGLCDLIPSYGYRTGSDWDEYISTYFRGIDRSVDPYKLGGQYVKAASTGDYRKSDALVKLLKNTVRAGGQNDIIIVNDETWYDIQDELHLQQTLFMATDGDKSGKQSATRGLNQMSVAFTDSIVQKTVADPYCPNGKAYMFDEKDLCFYDTTKTSSALDAVANGTVGKHEIGAAGDQGLGNGVKGDVGFNARDVFTIASAATPSDDGEQFRVSCDIRGNFQLRKTASSGVADLD